MAAMTTKSFTLPSELYEEAKRKGINISAACRRGIELELGKTQDIQTLKENIKKKEQDLDIQKDYLNKLLAEQDDKLEQMGNEENRLNQAFSKCIKEHLPDYGLGRDKIREIALKFEVDETILLVKCEEDQRLRLENFHFIPRETEKKVGKNPI